jgi:hypothetical protein
MGNLPAVSDLRDNQFTMNVYTDPIMSGFLLPLAWKKKAQKMKRPG